MVCGCGLGQRCSRCLPSHQQSSAAPPVSKEATVERRRKRCRDCDEILGDVSSLGCMRCAHTRSDKAMPTQCSLDEAMALHSFEGAQADSDILAIALALDAAKQAASERAWDEGWKAGAVDSEEAGYKRTANPYRQPAKGDGNGE